MTCQCTLWCGGGDMLSFWQLTFVVVTFIHVHHNAKKNWKMTDKFRFWCATIFQVKNDSKHSQFIFDIGCIGQE
jgi:hypothetical protein